MTPLEELFRKWWQSGRAKRGVYAVTTEEANRGRFRAVYETGEGVGTGKRTLEAR